MIKVFIELPLDLAIELRMKAKPQQELSGVIQELLDGATCPLCGKPTSGVHKECADYEAMRAE